MRSRIRHVTFHCRDPYALAGFWAHVVGGRRQDDDSPGDPSVLVTHAGTPLLFEQVPEDKTVPNRLHLDLQPEQSREQEVQRLLGLGASMLADRTSPDGSGWVVLADPEGNELCVERSAAERGQPPVDAGERRMPDVETAGEREMLEALLDWYREGVERKVTGMSQTDATTSALRSGTTAAGLVKHLALVEDHWFTHVVGRQPLPAPWAGVDFDADPNWEFRTATEEPLEQSLERYRAACARSRAAVQAVALDDVRVRGRGREYTLRFVLVHMLEETARHLGHLDVLRELADGATGE